MHKRILALLLVLAFVLSLVIPMAAQDEEVTLRWRTRPDNQAEIDVYSSVSEDVDASWDGVALEYEPGGSETASYQDVLLSELEAGEAPDVFWIPGTDVARFADAGVILNLADLAGADENFSVDDFYAGPMGFLTTPLEEGTDALWGLPRDVSAFAIYYNADLFDEAGLDYPGGDDWDWDALATAAEEITLLNDETIGFGMSNWWANYGYFINAAGSGFFNEDYTGCGLDNDATIEGMAFAQGLFDAGYAVPYGDNPEPGFLAGTVGMFMNGRWATPGVIASAEFNWNVAPLPIGPSGEATNWLFWGAYVVNSETENPAEAWDLVTRLTSAEVQGQIADLGANIPSRATDEAIELFLNTLPDSGVNNQAFVDGTTSADVRTEAPLFNGDWSEIAGALDGGANAVFNGDLSPEEFAGTICDQIADNFDS